MKLRYLFELRYGLITILWWSLSNKLVKATLFMTEETTRNMASSSATPLHTMEAASIVQCALFCELKALCISYSFNTLTSLCILYSTKSLAFDTPETGRQHFKAISCSSDWNRYNGHCYFFSKDKKKWTDAKTSCNVTGGYLIRIESHNELDWLKIQAERYDNFVNYGYYLGARDKQNEGVWLWESNGENMMISDFGQGEPDGNINENCILLHRSGVTGAQHYRYADVSCARREKFICEKD